MRGDSDSNDVAVADLPSVELLVVDDQPIVLVALELALSTYGFMVTAVLDPWKALELVAQAPDRFPAMITDLNMPGLTGLELASRIRECAPGIRVILYAGVLPQVSAAAIDAMVAKPSTMSELAREVRALLAPRARASTDSQGRQRASAPAPDPEPRTT